MHLDTVIHGFNASGILGVRSCCASGSCAMGAGGTSATETLGGVPRAPRSSARGVGGGHSDTPRTRETKKSLTQE